MKIHADFECGNIKVIKEDGCHICLQNDLRDTKGDWFYWAFCVEGAQGQTLTFSFDKERVGYYGAAVSHDLIHWHWTESRDSGSAFTYHFGEEEDKVYFAHDLLYSPTRLHTVSEELRLPMQTLCVSKKGREVPCLQLGEGRKNIVLTSRHHACESPGTYILEGFLREYLVSPIEDTRLFVVPMVDYDGVCDGDQGKHRIPHDHNRDYIDTPIHPEVGAIIDFVERNGAYLSFDFHAPAHCGGNSDKVFIVRKMPEKAPLFDMFGRLLEEQCGSETMVYHMSDDKKPNTGWNKDSTPTCSTFFNLRPECRLAFSLETTYFGLEDNRVTAAKLVNTGRAFCRAVKEFLYTDRV